MKNKGFSLVEIIVTFALISVITLLLFQIIINLKELYTKGDLRTALLINQANIEKRIYDDLNSNSISSIEPCGDNITGCIVFKYEDGTNKILDRANNKSLIYDGYSMPVAESSKLGNVEFSSSTDLGIDNATIYVIKIPLKSSLVDGNYGINIVYQK